MLGLDEIVNNLIVIIIGLLIVTTTGVIYFKEYNLKDIEPILEINETESPQTVIVWQNITQQAYVTKEPGLEIRSTRVRTNVLYSTEPDNDNTAYRLILSAYVTSTNSTPEEVHVIVTYPDGFKLTLNDTKFDDWGGSGKSDGAFLYVVEVGYQITGAFVFTATDGKANVSETYDNIEWLPKITSLSPRWDDIVVADELSFDFISPIIPPEFFSYELSLSYEGVPSDIWNYGAQSSVLPPVEYTGPQLSENRYEYFFYLNDLHGNTVHAETRFNIIVP